VSEDALWPRAASWLKPTDASLAGASQPIADIAVFGVPAHLTSISPTGANHTPAAIRQALLRYSTFSWAHEVDIANLDAIDLGDVAEPDSAEGEARTAELAGQAASAATLAVALGGDNSITYAVTRGVFDGQAGRASLEHAGLITLDAHHDLRDGISNGSPVRRLIDAGLNLNRIVQIGIADFSNSPAYAARAKEFGITVIPRDQLRTRSISDIWQQALDVAGAEIHVDFDVDVCDRSAVPGCPAAAPGGISADELRQFAYLAGASSQVRSLDISEIDATADAADGRTVRLGALVLLEAAAGLFAR
jgi:formimidoylglutamase